MTIERDRTPKQTPQTKATQLQKKEFPRKISSLCSFRIDVSYVCGMCIVFFLFFMPSFFPALAKKPLCTSRMREKGEWKGTKRKEERYGFRAWKILKIQPPTPDGKFLRRVRFICRASVGEKTNVEVALYCYISSSICIYLFFRTNILRSIFMYTRLERIRESRKEWKAKRGNLLSAGGTRRLWRFPRALGESERMSDRWHRYLK